MGVVYTNPAPLRTDLVGLYDGPAEYDVGKRRLKASKQREYEESEHKMDQNRRRHLATHDNNPADRLGFFKQLDS
jgi:hypothetical protein